MKWALIPFNLNSGSCLQTETIYSAHGFVIWVALGADGVTSDQPAQDLSADESWGGILESEGACLGIPTT